MRGNIDDTFFDSINEVFICLVCSAMRHCLKAWRTGVYVEPARNEHFKYETATSMYYGPDVIRNEADQYRHLQAIPVDLGCPFAPGARINSLCNQS